MSLNITPTYLDFPDSEGGTARHMYIGNPNKNRVIFKVKTTAPRDFCVKPNVAIIEPNDNKEVTIICLGHKDRTSTGKKVKFLLVSAVVNTDEYDSDLLKLWSHVESTTSKEDIHNKKIKVVYSEENVGNDTSDNVDATGADITAFGIPSAPSSNGHSSGISEETNGLKNRSIKSDSNTNEKTSRDIATEKKSTREISTQSGIGGLSVYVVILLVLIAFLIGWKLF